MMMINILALQSKGYFPTMGLQNVDNELHPTIFCRMHSFIHTRYTNLLHVFPNVSVAISYVGWHFSECFIILRPRPEQTDRDRGRFQSWRHYGCDGVSNHQPHDCLFNRLFSRSSKKTSKFRVTGLCSGNSPVTGEFPAQMASYAENVTIWWRHHGNYLFCIMIPTSLVFVANGAHVN